MKFVNHILNNFKTFHKFNKKDNLFYFNFFKKIEYSLNTNKYRHFINKFINYIICYNYNETIIQVDSSNLFDISNYIRLSSNFRMSKLIDLVVIDQLEEPRFKIIYNLINILNAKRAYVVCFIEDRQEIQSLSSIFKNANWMEREAWDMFGIFFANHKDLRRILTDYGFKGYPLRKDFPLSGYLELWYSDDAGFTVYEPIRLSQQLRFFNFTTLWEFN